MVEQNDECGHWSRKANYLFGLSVNDELVPAVVIKSRVRWADLCLIHSRSQVHCDEDSPIIDARCDVVFGVPWEMKYKDNLASHIKKNMLRLRFNQLHREEEVLLNDILFKILIAMRIENKLIEEFWCNVFAFMFFSM